MDAVFDVTQCQLDPIATQRVIDHVRSRWKLERCSVCQHPELRIRAGDPANGPRYPLAAILCAGCGYLVQLDLTTIGLVFPDEPEDE